MSIADVLIMQGWNQGSYRSTDGRVCIYGAAWTAQHGHLPEWDLLDELSFANCPTADALEKAAEKLGLPFPDALSAWQDEPERTFDEVLRVAKLADEILGAS